jgi:hypothetical protein
VRRGSEIKAAEDAYVGWWMDLRFYSTLALLGAFLFAQSAWRATHGQSPWYWAAVLACGLPMTWGIWGVLHRGSRPDPNAGLPPEEIEEWPRHGPEPPGA